MKRGSATQSATIRTAIEHGGLEEFALVMNAIVETGALDYARHQAEIEAKRAVASLDALPSSPCKESLIQLASFAVTRSH
jgi:octaprenyl-diphosphate synthase